MSEYYLVVGGERVKCDETFPVINPADESIVAECPKGDTDILDRGCCSGERGAARLVGVTG